MLKWIRKIDLKKAGICSVVIGIINICVYISVILSLIPYTWVNGGMTESLEAARQISASSIIMTMINILILVIASGIIPVRFNRFCGIVLSVFLIVTLPFSFCCIFDCYITF